jgi:hypothetical protein
MIRHSRRKSSYNCNSQCKPYVGNNLYHLKGNSEFIYKKNIFYHWKLELGIDLTYVS